MGFGLGILKAIMKPALKTSLKKLANDPDVKAIYKGNKTKHGKKAQEMIDSLLDHPDPKMRALGEKYKNGEVEKPAMTNDEALDKLKKAKEKLDLELITQEEYDKKKEELKQYIS